MNERSPDGLKVFAELDFGAFDGAASRAAVWRLRRRMPMWVEVVSVVLAISAGSVAVFAVPMGIARLAAGAPAAETGWFLAWALCSIAIVVGVVVLHRRWNRRHGHRQLPVGDRIAEFAEANGLAYDGISRVDSSLPAPSGSEGKVQRMTALLRPAPGSPLPPFVVGRRFFHDPVAPDFRPTERNPYPGIVDEGLFVAVRMPRRLPHIALLRSWELSASNLDMRTAYSMGVEFDETFTLLCPPGYETDALYLFTPDVMAAMLDDAGSTQWGAEVLDEWLFFRFPPASIPGVLFAEDLRRAFLLVERTSAELAKQASRYQDDRVGDRALDVVSDLGRRVSRRRAAPTGVIAGFGLPLMVLAPFTMIMGGSLLG